MYDSALDHDPLETGHADTDPARPNPIIDLGDSSAVRKFAREYLSALQRPLEPDAIHDVTAAISRYKGPSLIRRETLESFLALMLAPSHA
jgi:hypothetical protein